MMFIGGIMEIQRLTIQDTELIKQCDSMFREFLDSEGKYDENYLKRDELNSFAKDLNGENIILIVAKENDKALGFLYGYIESKKGKKLPVANLTFLYVNNEYRNKKIATNLIDAYLEQLKAMSITIVEVKTFENNTAARKLYAKYGFEILWSNYRKNI